MAKRGKTGGGRGLSVRIKPGARHSASSRRWLERQLNDPYVAEARKQGYRSRAAFKLAEMDDRFKLLKPGMKVVDLGAAPGGWAQVAAKRTRSETGTGKVIAVDVLEMEPLAGVTTLTLDFLDPDAPARLTQALDSPADLILSDMAPNTTGHRQTDHLRIVALVEAALDFACKVLAPGGAFVAKVWSGGTEGDLLAAMKRDFTSVRHVKPKASRAESPEVYVIATGFHGA